MWLIHTTKLELKRFSFPNVPPYAILSHTWTEEEVNFEDFGDLKHAQTKSGFAKIIAACRLACERNLEYAWVDTCCIQQSSSAELSESINSMYRWYQSASTCFAYLSDWPADYTWSGFTPLAGDGPPEDWEWVGRTAFGNGGERPKRKPELGADVDGDNVLAPVPRWFTRGWTLQELIAPKEVLFYDKDWQLIGSKADASIVSELARITGISADVLGVDGERNLHDTALGQRMSWAAHRNTTRPEDAAYCLLGLFQVNMPLLYGEGEQAFHRLQEAIIRSTTDLSIFAWIQKKSDKRLVRGILADYPREFEHLRDCVRITSAFWQPPETAMTNKGLRMDTSFYYRRGIDDNPGEYSTMDFLFLFLGCSVARKPRTLCLFKLGDVFVRSPCMLVPINEMEYLRGSTHRAIYIARHWDQLANVAWRYNLIHAIEVRAATLNNQRELRILDVWPPGSYVPGTSAIFTYGQSQLTGYITFAVFARLPQLSEKETAASSKQNKTKFRRMKELILLYQIEERDGSICLLHEREMHEFEQRMETLKTYDPIYAQQEYMEYCNKLLTRSQMTEVRMDSEEENEILVLRATYGCEEDKLPNSSMPILRRLIRVNLEKETSAQAESE